MNLSPLEFEALVTLLVWKFGPVTLTDADLDKFEDEQKKFGLHLVTEENGTLSVVGEQS